MFCVFERLITLLVLRQVIVALLVSPADDPDEVGDEARNLALEQGVVVQDDVGRVDASLVRLADGWNKSAV